MFDPATAVALSGEAVLSAPLADALAYIGPGAGIGAIAVTIALVLGVLLLLAGLVWYPVKRLLSTRTTDAAGPGHRDGPG